MTLDGDRVFLGDSFFAHVAVCYSPLPLPFAVCS